jgi:RNA polymerase-binding transcription factor DksA
VDESQLEHAALLEQWVRDSAIAAVRKKEIRIEPTGFDGTCECGEDIDPRRIDAGYYNCIDCAEYQEEQQARFASG